ncbi:MAG: hypothetical protein ACREGI_04505 [Candidatus Levyibacteriota bacterium]
MPRLEATASGGGLGLGQGAGLGATPDGKPYIISDDRAETARLLALSPRFPVRVSDTTLQAVGSVINAGLERALPESVLQHVGVADIREQLTRATSELQAQHGAIAVSLDSHYLTPDPTADIHTLQVTRYYHGSTGERLGRGPRPHNASIDAQIDHLARAAQGRPVVLAESGIMTGGTVALAIEMLKERGVEVRGVAVGLATQEALDGLEDQYPHLRGSIRSMVMMDSSMTDWTELRDFMPFVPDSGQTVGVRNGEGLEPLMTPDGGSGYTIPYALGRINRWATLSDEGAATMRVVGLRTTRALYEGVEAANGGRAFTFGDLVAIGPRADHQVKTTLPWLLAGFGDLGKTVTPQTRVIDLVDRILEGATMLPDGREVLIPPTVTAHRMYPGGNETVLVTTPVDRVARPEVARRLLATYPSAEQVGYIENFGREDGGPVRLSMAGGEFCGNAARSLITMLDGSDAYRHADGQYVIEVSGVDHPLRGSITADGVITVEMPIRHDASSIRRIASDMQVVALDGITHVVVDEQPSSAGQRTKIEADTLLTSLGLKDEPASGVIYLSRGEQGSVAIQPFVWVRDVGTLYAETACGSGSTAVGLVEAARSGADTQVSIMQPSGHAVQVSVEMQGGNFQAAYLSGPVDAIGREDVNVRTVPR